MSTAMMSAVPNLVPDVDFHEWALTPEDRSHIVTAEQVLEEYQRQRHLPAHEEGIDLGLPGHERRIRIRPGKVSVWTGTAFHGKSQLLKQCAMYWASRGEKVMLAMLEDTPLDAFRSMLQLFTRVEDPETNPAAVGFDGVLAKWLDKRAWFFSHDMRVRPDTIVGLVHYAAAELGCTQIIVDSLMRLDVKGDDLDGQNDLVNRLRAWAQKYASHVHLVAHPKKQKADDNPVTIHDVRGSGDITNLADNVFTVWRNMAEDRKLDSIDGLLISAKQRGRINWIGKIGLFHDTLSGQFLSKPDDSPRMFLPCWDYDEPGSFKTKPIRVGPGGRPKYDPQGNLV